MTTVRTIAVVGAGTMGSGIAQVFAHAGFDVRLHDRSAERLHRSEATMRASLDRLVAKATIDAEARDATLARVAMVPALDACAGVDVVIEAITEDAAAKAVLFATLDGLCGGDTYFASNTSSVSISRLGAAISHPERLCGMHFMNPVPLMPLVELVRGRDTGADVMTVAHRLCAALGKTPIEALDSPGFIANRILMPMINEAVHALMEGVGTAEAIDQVMVLGMKHPMGPLALADLIGLDICVAILDVLYEGFGDAKYRACPLMRQMVIDGQLGRKSGRGFHAYD